MKPLDRPLKPRREWTAGKPKSDDLFKAWIVCYRGHAPRLRNTVCKDCSKISVKKTQRKKLKQVAKAKKKRDTKRHGTFQWICWARKTFELFLQCWEYRDGYILPKTSLSKLQIVREMCQLLADMPSDHARYNYWQEKLKPWLNKTDLYMGKKRRFKD